MPEKSRNAPPVEGPLQTRLDPVPLLPKDGAPPLPGVVIVTPNLPTQAQAHVLLFRRDVPLASAALVASSRLRFHIEVNCRDAQQAWGQADCLPLTPTGGTNAAHLSLFMWAMGVPASGCSASACPRRQPPGRAR